MKATESEIMGTASGCNLEHTNRRALYEWSRGMFQTRKDHRKWWHRPHPLLFGQSPWLMAQNDTGSVQVRNLLVALKYGGSA